ncbi:MAG: GTPase Era [Longimicrobiales bacterium]|nr:GTPase Era [Longimicrobiales bacterium]
MTPDSPSPPPERPGATRCGYVAIAGRPNAGKSTLLNHLVGEKLSIVSPRAQTTWERVTGIRTTDVSQMVFLDTPGLLEVRDLHQKAMLGAAHEALREADVVLLVVDAARGGDEAVHPVVREALAETRAPRVVALNKMDLVDADALRREAGRLREHLGVDPIPVCATSGKGVDALVAALERALPEGPFLYPAEDLAIQPVRFFVAELVRETVFEHFEEEVPYAVATRVEEFRDDGTPTYIAVSILVERESQKGIVVGKGGRAIRELGVAARRKIETFLGRPVYLDLWVKPLKGWRRRKHHLERLGYRVPEEGA